MGERHLLDTSELRRPTQRKLHSAWAEIHGRKTMMPPTVAFELAPLGAPDTVEDGLSRAERMLRSGEKKMPAGRRMEVAQQAWWGRMWREEQSPYRVIELNEEQDRVYRNLLRTIDPGCFRNANAAFVSEHRGARAAADRDRSIAQRRLDSWMLVVAVSEASADRRGTLARTQLADAGRLRHARRHAVCPSSL